MVLRQYSGAGVSKAELSRRFGISRRLRPVSNGTVVLADPLHGLVDEDETQADARRLNPRLVRPMSSAGGLTSSEDLRFLEHLLPESRM